MRGSATPSRGIVRWALLAAGLGGLIGVGAYTFVYADGGSYLSDDPASCINCHVMQPHYDAWARSSHAAGSSDSVTNTGAVGTESPL